MITVPDEQAASLIRAALGLASSNLRSKADGQAVRVAAGEKIGVSAETIVETYAMACRAEALVQEVTVVETESVATTPEEESPYAVAFRQGRPRSYPSLRARPDLGETGGNRAATEVGVEAPRGTAVAGAREAEEEEALRAAPRIEHALESEFWERAVE